jgi:hypothetical protein
VVTDADGSQFTPKTGHSRHNMSQSIQGMGGLFSIPHGQGFYQNWMGGLGSFLARLGIVAYCVYGLVPHNDA